MTIKPELFKQVRKKLGLSQQELADALGLSRVTVNKMERGRLRRGIPDEIAARLMALKLGYTQEPWPKALGGGTVYASKTKTPVYARDAKEVVEIHGDAHLWDNEEDES